MKQPPPLPDLTETEAQTLAVRPHRSQKLLILAVAGFFFAPFGFFAVFLSRRDLRDMTAGTMDRTGEPTTRMAKLIGMIAGIVWAVKWAFLACAGLIIYFNWDRVRTLL